MAGGGGIKPIFQYIAILLMIATLIASILASVNTYQLKKALIPAAIDVSDFLKKLTSHEEMKSYAGIAPINLIQINSNNIAALQAQIAGLNASYLGDFIVQYADMIAIYDYKNDKIKAAISLQQPLQAQLPADFFAKLNKHAELKGMQGQQPISGQLDEASLSALKQQFPDVYAKAKVGDFILRYRTKLIIYDYKQDRVVNAVNLG